MGSMVAQRSGQDLLAYAHNQVRATVDTGGVQEPLQPCHVLFREPNAYVNLESQVPVMTRLLH